MNLTFMNTFNMNAAKSLTGDSNSHHSETDILFEEYFNLPATGSACEIIFAFKIRISNCHSVQIYRHYQRFACDFDVRSHIHAERWKVNVRLVIFKNESHRNATFMDQVGKRSAGMLLFRGHNKIFRIAERDRGWCASDKIHWH